jgi:cobalamin synthase
LGGVLAMVFTVSTWLYWRAFWADGWFVDPETPPATQISVLEDVALGTAAGASVVMLVSTVITTTVFASRPRSINGTE